MRVIRPTTLSAAARRRPLILAISMLITGVLALEVTLVSSTATGAAIGAGIAAIAFGVGAAWLVEKLRENAWNISKTAEVIGTPRSNLYKKLEQYAIRQETDG